MTTSQAVDQNLTYVIGRIAGVIGRDGFPTGERAALRRMYPDQPPPLTFYRFAMRYVPGSWQQSAEARKDWMTLVAGIALMSPGAYQPSRSLGTALGDAGYAEARLERLLSSEQDVRRVLLLRAARFLAARTSPFNWVDAAQLLLTRAPERREAVHRRIAADFYRATEAKSS